MSFNDSEICLCVWFCWYLLIDTFLYLLLICSFYLYAIFFRLTTINLIHYLKKRSKELLEGCNTTDVNIYYNKLGNFIKYNKYIRTFITWIFLCTEKTWVIEIKKSKVMKKNKLTLLHAFIHSKYRHITTTISTNLIFMYKQINAYVLNIISKNQWFLIVLNLEK